MRIDFNKLGSIKSISQNVEWSNITLSSEVESRMKALIQLGLKPNDRIIIAHGGTLEFFADLFAVWQLGGCACCINEDSTTSELIRLTSFVNATMILLGKDNVEHDLSSLEVDVVCLETECIYEDIDFQKYIDLPSLDLDALILFTSGTTGTPKGVTHTYRGILSRLSLNWEYIPSKEREVGLCPLPTHFGHGLIGNCLTVLMGGGDLIIAPGSILSSTGSLGELIDKYNVQFMSSVPSFWKAVLRSKKPVQKSLKRVHIGSAPLSSQLWNEIMNWTGIKNVVNMYGITETANWVCGASAEDFQPENGLIGRPWGGSVAVKNENDIFCSNGYGELLVQTPSLMREYFNLPSESLEVLKGGWFKTGDYGSIDEHGVIRLTGRKKYQINKAGIKIQPEDIDMLLESNEDISEACSFGIEDEVSGQVVGVAICPNNIKTFELNGIKEWIVKKIVKDKIPEYWFILDEIPKTDRGKVNRDNVAKLCLEQKKANTRLHNYKDQTLEILSRVIDLDSTIDSSKILAKNIDSWDSLATLRIMLLVEEHLKRQITTDELLLLNSYNGVKSVLENTVTQHTEESDKESQDELVSIIKNAGFGKKTITQMLISHSFCLEFGIKNIEKFLQRLIHELPKDATLVMGGFTWDFINSSRYSHSDSHTQIGIINEKFRRIRGVKRSKHPIYSYLSIGPLASELFKDQTNDSWGDGSVAKKLIEDYDTRVICLGLGLKDGEGLIGATSLHAMEQKFKVPYRFMKSFKGRVDFGGGYKKYEAFMYVRNLTESSRSSWSPAAKVLRQNGEVHQDLNGDIYAYDNKKLYSVACNLLEKDINIFKIS